ncbi:hypothetical protein ABZP36_023867 [Zizania latifolia]
MAALAAALAGLLLLAPSPAPAGATTDYSDAAALGNLYSSWNSPSQLAGWSAGGGGDPCGAGWQGISCSGAGVTEIYTLYPEPEFRPPMSEVVQQLVRLMQRASIIRRQSGEELGFSYRAPEREGDMRDISF